MERLTPHREVPIEPGIIQLTGGKTESAHMTLALTYLTRTDCGMLGTAHILPPLPISCSELRRMVPEHACAHHLLPPASQSTREVLRGEPSKPTPQFGCAKYKMQHAPHTANSRF